MLVHKIIYSIVLIWMSSVHLYAGISVTGAFAPADRSPAYISVLSDTGIVLEAPIQQGHYHLDLPSSLSQGIYRLAFSTQDKMRFYFIHTGQSSYVIDFVNQDGQWFQVSNSSIEHRYLSQFFLRQDTVLKPLRSLYGFVGSYPEKSSSLYQMALKAIDNKREVYEQFYLQGLSIAPRYTQAILKANKLEIYPVSWTQDSIDDFHEQSYWNQSFLKDTGYYRSPFFIERLDDLFSPYLDQTGVFANLPEKEKYYQVKKRIKQCLSQWKKSKSFDRYASVVIRYLLNKGYPYLLRYIDSTVSSDGMIAPVDRVQLAYRQAGDSIRKKMSLSELFCTNDIVKDTPNIVLYVGSPTPYGRSVLSQIDSVSKRDARRVRCILVQYDTESLQNLRSKYPHWSFSTMDGKEIQQWIERHHMYYLPLVYDLSAQARYRREWFPNE